MWGFDPTADSLHLGNLIPIMMLVHTQRAGHKPYALVGGATGMIGDPSGKSEERNLLDEATIEHNVACQKSQLKQFINFDDGKNKAELVNNYDWFAPMGVLDFLRRVGKHITINYMAAKESVKKRVDTGLSFTEFSYQLIQGYDFAWLFEHEGVSVQMGGADQWGNITTGTELIRRMHGGEAHALTCPLMTKADGGKFGKTESGTVWLDRKKTSPYSFYQFWINTSDADIGKYMRTFSLKSKEEIESLEKEHAEVPHLRIMQKAMAAEITERVHSKEDLEMAEKASSILFGKSTQKDLMSLNEETFLDVFKGVDQAEIDRNKLELGIAVVDLFSEESGFLSSKGEARRNIKQQAIRLNKEKIDENLIVNPSHLMNNKYLLLQKGKRNYFIVKTN
jgi:tyrosyl-tRNA synthetase